MRFMTTIALSALLLVACGDDGEESLVQQRGLGGGSSGGGGSDSSAGSSTVGGDIGEGEAEAVAEPEGLDYPDDTFVAADIENRDPFRGFAESFAVRVPQRLQRRVILSDVSIEEMRLVAIVSGTELPRAMLVAPDGVGHVVKRGDFIGRPEVVQSASIDAVPVTLNWRVERIRAQEVVLTREDPTDRNRPPLMRVLPLHDDDGTNPISIPVTS